MHCAPITAPLRILCAHADQRFVFDRAAMEDRLVADRDSRTDGQRRAGIGMADSAVLEIAFFANA